MSLELRFLSGSRSGQRETVTAGRTTIGRHPSNGVRFDPEKDRDVSSRHAELSLVNGQWMLKDTGSTNGTFVNGTRLAGEVILADGDVISFGAEGPRAEVRLSGAVAGTMVSPARGVPVAGETLARPSLGGAPRGSGAVVHPSPAKGSTHERIALAVKQQTKPLRYMLAAAVVLALVGVGGALLMSGRADKRNRDQIALLLAQNDSLAREFQMSMSAVRGVDSALATAQREVKELRSRLQNARGNDVAVLSRELNQIQERNQALLSADYSAIDQTNRKAVVMLAVEKADGVIEGGSGFSVSPDGHIVTNRHVVLDANGNTPRRIAVIFNDTREWRPASLVRTSREADLALLKMDESGEYPVVAGIAPSARAVRVGSPVAILGYPLSLDTPMQGSGMNILAASTLGPGTVSKMLDDVVQVDAFAGTGSSGSGLFDARGNVIGVIYGGARESNGRIVYAVPSERLIALLPAEAKRLVR